MSKKKVLRQIVGIDVSSEKFDVCFLEEDQTGKQTVKGSSHFSNDYKGFKLYLEWFSKRKKDCPLTHVMEATGVYHENLCHFLYDNNEQVSVELAQKVKYFSKSLNQKSKTDKKDAKLIALYGLSMSLDLWEPISKEFKDIKELCRILSWLKHLRSITKNQVSALGNKHQTPKNIQNIMIGTSKDLNKRIKTCEDKILKLVKKDTELYLKVERICEIKGVGMLTVLILLAETDGFRKCSSIRKLVSYSGLDVVEHQSGNTTGRTRISKKGNSYIRQALYMPALTVCRSNQEFQPFYKRLNERQVSKKQGVIAVMRKLLILIYTLWKNGQEYNPNHQWGEKNKKIND